MFSFRTEETVTKNVFLSQKLMMEFTDRNVDHYEIAIQLGAGGRF